MSRDALTTTELRAVTGLAGLYGLRMLGLFMVLPVMPLLLENFPGATPLAIGLAIGIYGLTQAMLQLPFGWLSDKLGRKPLIYAGLALFALGSLVAAAADSMLGLILGRALQGMGAIASVLMALLADLTRDEKRTQAMASVGISIGLAFIAAMALGPWLASCIGLSGLFWMTALLSGVGMLIVWRWVPDPLRSTKHLDAGIQPARIKSVILQPQLLRLDASILVLHLLLTAVFIAVPGLLVQAGWDLYLHGWIYLGSMLLGFFAMIPLIIIAEKGQKMKAMLLLGIGLLALALPMLGTGAVFWLLFGLWVFFIGFNLLEASLPSLISKQAPMAAKGTAMGVYSTSQFLGAFLGGLLGGWVMQRWDAELLLWGATLLVGLWWLLMLSFAAPRHLSSRVFSLHPAQVQDAAGFKEKLLGLPGVVEVELMLEEATGYLKLDRKELDEEALDSLIAGN
ncbi:MFS transporter [Marinospirillum sp. MEB164]|uniref:MFS transporter n=1 Tax=Marinospirillum alkalitolerans TaxID=3123374 RepID=A0ABW8PZG7_9GAMM